MIPPTDQTGLLNLPSDYQNSSCIFCIFIEILLAQMRLVVGGKLSCFKIVFFLVSLKINLFRS